MVEEVFSSSQDEVLSDLAQSQQQLDDAVTGSGSGDSQQIIKTLAIINYLKVTVLVIIGFIMLQQIYYRLFAKKDQGNGRKNPRAAGRNANARRNGQRPYTRAEALLVMLENNGCPPEQLQTLRNTVTNQDVKNIHPEDFQVEQKKRSDRRVEINRPKRSVMFNLEENKVKEFRISDVVQSDDQKMLSAERNQPKTPGRLVKLKPTQNSNEASGVDSDDSKQANVDSSATASQQAKTSSSTEPIATSNQAAAQANAQTSESGASSASAVLEGGDQSPASREQSEENFETQSGDSSNQDEEVEQASQVLPTLSDINSGQQVSAAAAQDQSTVTSEKTKKPVKSTSSAKKGKPTQQFEEESKVHEEDPISGDEDVAESVTTTATD